MKRKGLYFIPLLLISFSLIVSVSISPNTTEAFSGQIIQKGATGDDVIELQARLQYIGFYNGEIDGVFGWGTYWALRNFQHEFGLKVDGLAGAKTRQKLAKASQYDRHWVKTQIKLGREFTYYGGTPKWQQTEAGKNKPGTKGNQGGQGDKANQGKQQQKAQQPPAKQPQGNQGGNNTTANQNNTSKSETKNTNIPGGYSANDIQLMANAVYGESRGEPYVGQVAVAAVILNRVESASFPNTIAGVIFEPRAFTAVADGQIWLTPNETAEKAVRDALNGWDPTGGAIYYFNPNTATSGWIWSRPQIKQIGKHIFAK
jgi:N-acetylmuramoyl-L-alanine amidase